MDISVKASPNVEETSAYLKIDTVEYRGWVAWAACGGLVLLAALLPFGLGIIVGILVDH